MKYTYEEISNELNALIVIKRTDETGEVWWIPMDEGNSDYQRYLNPEAAQFTPIVTEDE
jgi:hypothetical protein